MRPISLSKLNFVIRSMSLPPFSSLTQQPGEVGRVSYEQVCGIVKSSKKADKSCIPVLIDVRPPSEINEAGGSIPSAQNIPLADVEMALNMDPITFQSKYGWPKPEKGHSNLVFFCKMGIRGQKAAETASRLGFHSFCYPGSYGEWKEKCGQK